LRFDDLLVFPCLVRLDKRLSVSLSVLVEPMTVLERPVAQVLPVLNTAIISYANNTILVYGGGKVTIKIRQALGIGAA
jgi:hypothetical protein